MIRYAQSSQCRMSSLVRHFGDMADGQKPCGICDFCAPEKLRGAALPASHGAGAGAGAGGDRCAARRTGRSVGKLHTELCSKNGIDRDEFEELMGAMARAGLVRLMDAVFEKDGKQIPFRKASLTRDAAYVSEESPLELTIRQTMPVIATKGRRKKASAPGKKRVAKAPVAVSQAAEEPVLRADSKTAAMLKAWRLAVAKKQGVPAFRVMSDRVLLAIAEDEPRTAAELLAIPGMGIKLVEKYGAQIYRVLNEARG